MTSRNELLEARFLTNMSRINGLVRLLNSSDSLKPIELFQSEGVRADLFRAVVVFLHATFEVLMRGHIPNQKSTVTFYSANDIEKALKQSAIDPEPFQPLYPPLIQLAKRRKQIVHEADLSKRTDTVAGALGVVDEWQLPIWLMAVSAFYYQLRKSTHVASPAERTMYKTIRKAMASHVDFGNQLLAFTKALPELQIEALQRIVVTLEGIAATLTVDANKLEWILSVPNLKFLPLCSRHVRPTRHSSGLPPAAAQFQRLGCFATARDGLTYEAISDWRISRDRP